MEVLNQLGIDWKLFIAQAVNFLIVLAVLWKFAYKPILKLLQERSAKIEKSLKDATQVEQLKAQAETDHQRLINAGRTEAQEIVQKAQATIEQNRQAQIEKTKSELQALIQKAKAEISQEKQQMLRDVQSEVGTLAVNIAERLIKKELNQADQSRLIAEALKQVKEV